MRIMDEEEFQKILPHLRKALTFALENPISDFYRTKYAGLDIQPKNIKTYADFCKIPMLTKDEILALPLSKRFFVPVHEAIRYSISSGTASHNKPLIIPHIPKVIVNGALGGHTVNEGELHKLGINKLFGLMPAQSILMTVIAENNRTIPMIIPDISKLDMASTLAKELEIEAIISSPTILYNFTERLKKTNFDLSKIKWISISSEFCTTQKFEYFKKAYPKAMFKGSFGNSECGAALGFRCEHLREHPPQLYHPTDMHLLEIISEKGDKNEEGFGEMVFTHLTRVAFPLIRYQTNDFATKKPYNCECGLKYVIDTSGKSEFDILKTSGVVFHTQAIADAVESVSQYVESEFQLHVYEETINGKILTRLTLLLIPKKNNLDASEIASYIEKQFQVSVDKMLDDLVKKGLFLPLKVKFVAEINGGVKSRHIISHLHNK